MIRPGSTSLSDQPGDNPPLPSERTTSTSRTDVYEPNRDNENETPDNINSDVRNGDEKVPARDHDQDDKLDPEEQAELHNISVREARLSDLEPDGRPPANR